mmetsp:Transcript_21654/g.34740  ORF Transcript_21654/g.34740 Transcript_21654/m.34740 type:complete len:124 (+) Transcript_21654:89-460(+)
MPTEIESAEEFSKIVEAAKKDSKVVIAKFGAEWCGPCKVIAPYFKELEGKYSDMIFLEITYDKEENEDVIEEYKILKLPTFVVIKDGKEAERYQGANKDDLKELVSNQFKDAVQNAFSMDEDF